jgi:F0F1-type ATP synthase membrane subunit b/b'
MIRELIVAFQEIFAAVVEEVASNPWGLLAEVTQFLLLVAIIWVVAMGTRKRRGFVANMLVERDEHVQARLEEAGKAEQCLAESTERADARLTAAAKEAEQLLSDARMEAEKIAEQVSIDAETEADRIVSRAESALVTERSEMELEVREELVDLVAQATRLVMSEKVSLDEQRRLIEGAIVASVGALTVAAKPTPPASPSRASRRAVAAARESS